MRLTPRVAGFRLEYPAGFELECMAGFVGTRTPRPLLTLVAFLAARFRAAIAASLE